MSAQSADEADDADEYDGDTAEEAIPAGQYYGDKWGVYVRGPQVWFDLLHRFEEQFCMLGDLASVRFGVKTGKDAFFYPKDVSRSVLEQEPDPKSFALEFGATRKEVLSGKVRIVACGEKLGELRPIESKYLEPEIHSLMEIEHFAATKDSCARQTLLVWGRSLSMSMSTSTITSNGARKTAGI